MYNFCLLLKTRLKEQMDASVLMSVLLYVVGLVVFYRLGVFMAEEGLTDLLPLAGYLGAAVICFVVVVMSINETFSGNEDSEFLLSTPLPAVTQVFVMFFLMYAKNVLFTAMIEAPFYVVYTHYAPEKTFGFGAFLIGLFITCLPICGIATLIGMVVLLSLVNSPKKNQIMSGLALFFIVIAVLILMVVIDRIYLVITGVIVLDAPSMCEALISEIIHNIRLARFYHLGIVGGNLANIFLFFFMSFIWYAVFLFMHTMAYQSVITELRCPVTYGNKEKKVLLSGMKEHEQKKAVWRKELEQFVGSKTYLTHSVMGVVLGLMLPINLLVIGVAPARLMAAVPALICVFVGLGCTTYCAFSMEGRRYWIMESAPVHVRDMRRSKLTVDLLVNLPMAVISGILFAVLYKPGVLLAICYIVIPVAFAIGHALWGAWIGARFADYGSESEIQVMRQGKTYLLGYLPGVIVPAIVVLVQVL